MRPSAPAPLSTRPRWIRPSVCLKSARFPGLSVASVFAAAASSRLNRISFASWSRAASTSSATASSSLRSWQPGRWRREGVSGTHDRHTLRSPLGGIPILSLDANDSQPPPLRKLTWMISGLASWSASSARAARVSSSCCRSSASKASEAMPMGCRMPSHAHGAEPRSPGKCSSRGSRWAASLPCLPLCSASPRMCRLRHSGAVQAGRHRPEAVATRLSSASLRFYN